MRELVSPRRALILQGPVGSFFDKLYETLECGGWEVRRIVFNGGDWFFSKRANRVIYRGGHGNWRSYLTEFLQSFRPDIVFLFGDERPIHKIAIEVFKSQNIDYWCFEEGYIRPGYITFERFGNNGNSALVSTQGAKSDGNVIELQPDLLSDVTNLGWRGLSRRMGVAAVKYYLFKTLGRFYFPGYVHHRKRRLLAECVSWVRAGIRRRLARRHDKALIERIAKGQFGRYFVVLLQVPDDLQLVAHGLGWRNESFISSVISSFAKFAPEDSQLVFKIHPLNLGHGNDRANILNDAFSSGILSRVHVMSHFEGSRLVDKAEALLTINSTSGMFGLQRGKPVLTVGKAIYNRFVWREHSASRSEIDEFWSAYPEMSVKSSRIISHFISQSLVPGDFYSEKKWTAMLENCLRRATNGLFDGDVDQSFDTLSSRL